MYSMLLAETALADRPAFVIGFVIIWFAVGLVVASVMARRGHEFRPLGALGVVFGPLLIGFALASLRPREETVKPVVLRPATPLGGSERVVIAVLGPPDRAADAIPILSLGRQRLGAVELVRPITFESADADDGDGDREQQEASRALEQAALFLDDYRPGLVLVPGTGTAAVRRYVEQQPPDLLLVAGGDHHGASANRGLRDRTVTVVLDGSHPQ